MEQRDAKPVRWETVQVLFSTVEETKLASIGVVAEIVHPVVNETECGEPRLNITIRRTPRKDGLKEHSLRFFCPDGELVEIDMLQSILSDLIHKREQHYKSLASRRRDWNEKRIKDYDTQTEVNKKKIQRDGSSGVGAGLSRFSNASKTEKKHAKVADVKPMRERKPPKVTSDKKKSGDKDKGKKGKNR